jgi:hypothetical protein
MTKARTLADFIGSDSDVKFDTDTLYIDSSANRVGFGTTSPGRIAELYGTSNPALRLNNGTDVADIGLATAAGALLTGSTSGALVLARGGANAINLGTNGTNRVTINSSGNVGIGTATPASTLEVNGIAMMDSARLTTNSGTSYWDIRRDSSTGHLVVNEDGLGDVISVLQSNGNVGIGTSSPASQLHLFEETSNTTTRSDQVRIHAASSGTTGVGFGSNIYFTGERANGTLQAMGRLGFVASTNTSSNLSSDFIVETASAGSPAERMRINANGTIKQTAASQGSAFAANTISTWNALEIFQDRGVTNSASGIAFRSQSGTAPAGIVSVVGNTTGGVENLAFITSTGNNSFERARITHDGHFVVGVTSTNGVTNGAGTYIAANGQLYASTNSAGGHYLNRTDSNDGVVLNIRHQGTTVGSIGTYSSRIYIGTGDTGLGFSAGSDSVFPITAATGAIRDAAVDLGLTTGRFRDLQLSRNCMASNFVAANDSDTFIAMTGGNIQRYFTGGSEKARLDATGNFLIGCTSLPDGSADGIGLRADSGERRFSRSGTSARYQIQFYNGNGAVGRIETSGTSTSYVTSSDYRLKENVTDISDGITRLKQLQPRRFNFIADADTTVDGFIAHEAAIIIPEAVTGTKDAVMDEEYEVKAAVTDDDGAIVEEAEMGTRSVPDMQGIDQSKIVPLLTAALQEAIAKIETLETKVAVLEAG